MQQLQRDRLCTCHRSRSAERVAWASKFSSSTMTRWLCHAHSAVILPDCIKTRRKLRSNIKLWMIDWVCACLRLLLLETLHFTTPLIQESLNRLPKTCSRQVCLMRCALLASLLLNGAEHSRPAHILLLGDKTNAFHSQHPQAIQVLWCLVLCA